MKPLLITTLLLTTVAASAVAQDNIDETARLLLTLHAQRQAAETQAAAQITAAQILANQRILIQVQPTPVPSQQEILLRLSR